jgi:hypothetical protein
LLRRYRMVERGYIMHREADAVGPLNERYAYVSKVLDDVRVVDLVPLTFGRVRLTVSANAEAQTYTEAW